MDKQAFYIDSVLRFRRWSRAGYAVFCSLSSRVTIGVLSVSVSDKSCIKSGCVLNNSLYSASSLIDFQDEDGQITDPEAVFMQLQEVLLSNVSFDCVPAYSKLIFHIHHNG